MTILRNSINIINNIYDYIIEIQSTDMFLYRYDNLKTKPLLMFFFMCKTFVKFFFFMCTYSLVLGKSEILNIT